jgi:hypothetical protein
MKYLMTAIVAAVALGAVTLAPGTAEARRHYGGWGVWGPGVGITIGPRYGYRHYGNRHAYRHYGWRHRDWRYSRNYGPRWRYRNFW